ncbi:MAG: hypothetical protein ACTSRG_00785 [Candidatus Helarchaeota archaeon]
MLATFGAMLGFGRLALGIAVLILCLVWAYHKEYRRVWVALLVGTIQGSLDLTLMIILWFQPYDILVHIFDIFIYSTWLLLFKIEKLDYNGMLFYIMLTTLISAFLELLAINLTSFLGVNLFYPPGWNGYLSLIYFGAMSGFGLGLYLFIFDKDIIKKLIRNEL